MFAIDSGGANSLNVARPFLYQGRSLWGIGSMATMIAYQKVKRPNLKRVGILGGVFTGTGYAQLNPYVNAALKNAGYDIVTSQYPPTATTDFSPFITALQRANPEIIVMPTTEGVLNTTLLKQAEGLGLKAPFVAIDYDRTWAVNAPKDAVSRYEFAFDYFDSNHPPTQWGKLFVQEYQRVYNELPDYYAANYYESAFLVWNLVQRIIAAGEDPAKSGPNYVNAFAKNPSFPSVYSATVGVPHGVNTFSNTQHTVTNRPTAYGHGNPDGSGTVLANALQSGAQFKFTAAGNAVPVAS
jgi:branched-chain amino acid transport system substrate-binding protein